MRQQTGRRSMDHQKMPREYGKCSCQISVIVIKLIKANLGKLGVYSPHRLQSVIRECQGKIPRLGHEALENTAHCSAQVAFLYGPGSPAQGWRYLQRLNCPPAINNQVNAEEEGLQASLMESIPQLCVQQTFKIDHYSKP